MFPRWDNDEEDEKIVNIVKAMYGKFGNNAWRWNPSHWPVKGVKPSNNLVVVKVETVEKEGKVGKGTKIKADSDEDGDEEGSVKRVNRGADFLVSDKGGSLVEELRDEMEAGFNSLGNLMKEGFIGIGIKFDFLNKNVDDLAVVVDGLKTDAVEDEKKKEEG